MARIERYKLPGIRTLARAPDAMVVRDVSAQTYLLNAVRVAMDAEGYSERNKSKWIVEAFAGLRTQHPDILISDSRDGDTAVQGPAAKMIRFKLTIPDHLDKDLARTALEVRTNVPDVIGEVSYVVRCAIRFRLRYPQNFEWTRSRSALSYFMDEEKERAPSGPLVQKGSN